MEFILFDSENGKRYLSYQIVKAHIYERVMKVIRGDKQGLQVVYNENGQTDDFLLS